MPKYIRIVKRPPGQAPEVVRNGWIGVEIPLLPQQGGAGLQLGVKGGAPENWGGYRVNGKDAVEALQKKNPIAAQWWREKASWVLGNVLVFTRDCCEVFDDEDLPSA